MWMLVASALAAPLFPVQGAVYDASNQPLNGPRSVTFALYTSESAPTAAWFEPATVDFIDGGFNAHVGATTPVPATLLDDESLWLGVTVTGQGESGRVPVGFAPRAAWASEAGNADTLDGLTSADFWQKTDDIAWSSLDGTLHPSATTGYAAGAGLTLSGTTFSTVEYTAGPGVTISGGAISAVPYAAGAGLTLSGTTFAAVPYTAGSGVSISGNAISATPYTAGSGISISGNAISATPYTAGTGLSLAAGQFSVTQSTVQGWAYDSAAELTSALATQNGLGVGVAAPTNGLRVGGWWEIDGANKVVATAEHERSFSGNIVGPGNWPACTEPAKVVTIGTLTASSPYQSYLSIELYGSHRGFDRTSNYFDYKRWIILTGDKVSSNLVLSSGAGDKVDLWNGSARGMYNNIDVTSGFPIRLHVNPQCGSEMRYTYVVRYHSGAAFTPNATRAW
jgi:hypothetical protein